MADVFTKKRRSEIMSRIRAKNTKLEQDFLKALSAISHKKGYRYRKHYSRVPGKPDIAFPAKKVAVFIDGCFWHGCPLHSRIPRSNISYWKPKLDKNKLRDRKINLAVKKDGWKILRLWEHQIKKKPLWAIGKIMRALQE